MPDLAIAFTDGSEPELPSAPPTLVSVPGGAGAAAGAAAPALRLLLRSSLQSRPWVLWRRSRAHRWA